MKRCIILSLVIGAAVFCAVKCKNAKKKTYNVAKNKNHGENYRLSVLISNKHIYAQIIDDNSGTTILSASSRDMNIKGSNIYHATTFGALFSTRSIEKGITNVSFYLADKHYHGRVKSFAEAAKEAGLKIFFMRPTLHLAG
uniref:Uncharacterized protein n=1 Tax=viral metagenome TaxID=1070528 RepID=A0A6C0JZQ1_9ZZZZ